MPHPFGEHDQDLVDHLFLRRGSRSTAPLDSRPKYRPTHHQAYRFYRDPPSSTRGWNLLEPTHHELREFLLHSPFKQGFKLCVRGPTLAMHLAKEVEYRPDKHMQGIYAPI